MSALQDLRVVAAELSGNLARFERALAAGLSGPAAGILEDALGESAASIVAAWTDLARAVGERAEALEKLLGRAADTARPEPFDLVVFQRKGNA